MHNAPGEVFFETLADAALVLLRAESRVRFLALSSLAWVLYDYCLTLEQEMTYLWAGPWSTSKMLFFWNRYFSPAPLILSLICMTDENLNRTTFCPRALQAVFITSYIGITVVQAIIVLRVWHILSGRFLGRILVLIVFAISVIVSAREFAVMLPTVKIVRPILNPFLSMPSQGGCFPPSISRIWTVFLPYLLAQTVLFFASLWPVFNLWRRGRHSQVMNQLVLDGSVFYLAYFAGAVYTTAGSFQKSDISVLETAVFSNLLLAVSSVSVSRLLLRIGSLASHLNIEPNMLLSTAELSRVKWRRGTHDGEIIVEINTIEDSYGMDAMGGTSGPGTSGLYTTEVGVYDDISYPFPRV